MATIGAMMGQMGTMYSMIQQRGGTGSLFGARQPQKLNYAAWQTNASSGAESMLSSRNELNSLLKDYDTTKATFNKQYSSTMSDMKTATQGLKGINYAVAPTGASEEKIAANVKTATDAVQSFADKYNATTKFLGSNSEVSNRVKALGNSFGDVKYFAKSLESVGISQDSKTGNLTVDAEKLVTALKERPEATKYVIGGLADRTASKVSTAQLQKSRMFQTAAQMMGTTESGAKAMYSASALAAQSRYGAVGNLINMLV